MKSFILEAGTAAQEKDFDRCAQILCDHYLNNKVEIGPKEGLPWLQRLIPGMLSRGLHVEVAHILWGENLFSAEPDSVKLIWEEVRQTATLLIQGAGAIGKSYSLAAYFLLDWLEDPLYTALKVVSATREHAQRNAFAHIKELHRQSSIPLPGLLKGGSIQADDNDKQGIHLVAIPQGEDGAGRLQGFHPVPRKKPHPKYGILSRVRVILDEAEEIPGGVWDDVDNMLITMEGHEHVKITAAANPRDIDSKFGKRCEPIGSWNSIDIEDSQKWKSRLGWNVVRLDGAQCENVKAKRIVFPGLLTYDGYRRYLLAGDTDPEYLTMARGWFPSKGLAINVIPRDFMDRAIARLNFTGAVTYCASVDLAFEGEDEAIVTVGRFGMATGYNQNGVNTYFPQSKYALQAESQFAIPKNDPTGKLTQTPWIVSQIKMHCTNLSIKALWLICDRTGNGTGAHDMLRSDPPEGIGPEVSGIHFGAAATEMKIFRDSKEKACDLYDGIVTELFFATRNFLEFDYLKISPSMDIQKLKEELCTRRYKPGRTLRVEGKKEFKARGNNSPDRCDSLTLLVHLIRLREGFEAMLLPQNGMSERERVMPDNVIGKLGYMDWGEN